MTLTKNFDEKYGGIVELVENEIKKGYNGNKSLHQLKSIIIDLEKMKEIRNSRQFTPSYPRFIIDSWNFNDALELKLMNFFEMYKRL